MRSHRLPPPARAARCLIGPGAPPPLLPLAAGSNSPSLLPSYQQRELLELAVKSCKALGLQIVSSMAMGLGERLPSLSIAVRLTDPACPPPPPRAGVCAQSSANTPM